MYTETALLAALCAALTLVALDGSAQTSKGKMPKSKDYYLLESKKQKTAGWISLAAGFAGFAIGAAMDRGNLVQDGFIFDEYQNAEKKRDIKRNRFHIDGWRCGSPRCWNDKQKQGFKNFI